MFRTYASFRASSLFASFLHYWCWCVFCVTKKSTLLSASSTVGAGARLVGRKEAKLSYRFLFVPLFLIRQHQRHPPSSSSPSPRHFAYRGFEIERREAHFSLSTIPPNETKQRNSTFIESASGDRHRRGNFIHPKCHLQIAASRQPFIPFFGIVRHHKEVENAWTSCKDTACTSRDPTGL